MTTRIGALLTLALLSLQISMHAQETNPVKLVKGMVLDATSGKPVDGGTVEAFVDGKGESVARSRINPKTGAYQIVLSPGTAYRIHITGVSFHTTDLRYSTAATPEYEESTQNFSIKPIVMGSTLYRGALFARKSSTPGTSAEFYKALALLGEQPYITVTITVAGDPPEQTKRKKGEATASTLPSTLVDARIATIRSALESHGIAAERVTIQSAATLPSAGSPKKSSADNVVITLTGTTTGAAIR